MRILYGVHGYGRGHATRTLAVLPHLAQRHQVHVLAGGDAYATLWSEYPVTRIPTLGFAYRGSNASRNKGPRQRSNWQTLRRNIPPVLDLYWGGATFDMVRGLVEEFAPDVIISDAECWTHQVAAHLKIPRISFDHIGILAYCQPPVDPRDRLEAWLDATCYRALMGQPDRILISSFYDAPPRRPGVKLVGTLPRRAIREVNAHANNAHAGNHLLVYFNRGHDQMHADFLRPLEQLALPVHIYGSPQRGRTGNLDFRPPSGLPFLEDLAACRAVISTAGNQLVGEAMYLGKPILVMPERCVEQRMNARAVARLGIGMSIQPREFTLGRLREFLQKEDVYHQQMAGQFRDGLPEALTALDTFLAELAPWSRSQPLQPLEHLPS